MRFGVSFLHILGLASLSCWCCQDVAPPAPEPGTEQQQAAVPIAPGQKADPHQAATPLVAPPGSSTQTEDEQNSIAVFKAAAPATVFVTNKRVVDYFSRRVEVPQGSGTGFIWDRQGHVVTNYHVVQGAKALSITLHDHSSFDARVVGVERRKDIAVLRIESPPSDLMPLRVEKGVRLQVGQKTLAIGNPFGLDQTLTTGVISALGRSMPGPENVTIRDMVQTDAAINPGNSGGPLLDSSGRLIGMNTMIFSRSGASAGIGFAVPVSAITRIVPQIIENGKAEQIGIGIEIDPEQQLEARYRIRGVVIQRVFPGGPAAAAGLEGLSVRNRRLVLGDVIVAVDGQPVDSYDELYNAVDKHRAGDEVEMTVQRGSKRRAVRVNLVVLP